MMPSVTETQPFANYQYEIYLAGMADQQPELPYFAPADWEARFRETATAQAYGYVAGAAGAEDTLRENLEAFRRWRIVPRMLRDISARDTSTELFGAPLHAPLLLAPIGVQSIVHPDGELAVRARRTRARHPDDPLDRGIAPDRGRRRRAGRDHPLVSALLAQRFRAGRELRAPRRGRRLRGDRPDLRHVHARVAPARPVDRLPALPEGHRHRQLPDRPRVP